MILHVHNDVNAIQQLTVISDGYKECIGFTQEDNNNFMTHLCRMYVLSTFFSILNPIQPGMIWTVNYLGGGSM